MLSQYLIKSEINERLTTAMISGLVADGRLVLLICLFRVVVNARRSRSQCLSLSVKK